MTACAPLVEHGWVMKAKPGKQCAVMLMQRMAEEGKATGEGRPFEFLRTANKLRHAERMRELEL